MGFNFITRLCVVRHFLSVINAKFIIGLPTFEIFGTLE